MQNGSSMNEYQKDIGFLLLIKFGDNPFSIASVSAARDEVLAGFITTHTDAELHWLANSIRLYADLLLQDGVIVYDDISLDQNIYRLSKEFIEEIRNEK